MSVLDVERDNGLVTLTLNRPDKKNAIDREIWSALASTLAEIAANPDDRAVMITGAGGNFSSGADLSGASGGTGGEAGPALPIITEMRTISDIMLRLHRLPIPTLAKIDGVAVGVGLGLALGCDLVVASEPGPAHRDLPPSRAGPRRWQLLAPAPADRPAEGEGVGLLR